MERIVWTIVLERVVSAEELHDLRTDEKVIQQLQRMLLEDAPLSFDLFSLLDGTLPVETWQKLWAEGMCNRIELLGFDNFLCISLLAHGLPVDATTDITDELQQQWRNWFEEWLYRRDERRRADLVPFLPEDEVQP